MYSAAPWLLQSVSAGSQLHNISCYSAQLGLRHTGSDISLSHLVSSDLFSLLVYFAIITVLHKVCLLI